MCRRLESIAALSAAADRLTEVCELKIHAPPIAPANPVRAGVGKALRAAFRDLSTTPADMAVTLKKLN